MCASPRRPGVPFPANNEGLPSSAAAIAPDATLDEDAWDDDVVCWFLADRGRREEAYVRLRSVLKDANFEPPAALRQLASITDFDLFVSTRQSLQAH